MKILKYLNFYKKLDLFLLLNYPSIWSMRLHHVFIVSSIISLLLFLYPFKLYQIPYTYSYMIYIVLIVFAYWLFKQREFIASKNYTKVLIGARSEFILYIITIFFFFLPFFTILIVSSNLIKNEFTFDTEKIHLEYIEFNKNTLKYKCSYNKDENTYEYDDEGKEFCPINDENTLLLEKLVHSLSTIEDIDKIEDKDLITIKSRCNTLKDFDIKSYIENILFGIFIFIPFLIIYFKHSSTFGKKWFFIPIYLGILLLILIQLIDIGYFNSEELLFSFVENQQINKFIGSIIVWLYLVIPLIMLYIYILNYRLVIFFQIITFTIFICVSILMENSFLFEFDLYFLSSNSIVFIISISIILFFSKAIRNHVIFLSSQPKDL